jgi:hypothetical protein
MNYRCSDDPLGCSSHPRQSFGFRVKPQKQRLAYKGLPQGCSAKREIITREGTHVQNFLFRGVKPVLENGGVGQKPNGMDKGAARFPEVNRGGADAEK